MPKVINSDNKASYYVSLIVLPGTPMFLMYTMWLTPY